MLALWVEFAWHGWWSWGGLEGDVLDAFAGCEALGEEIVFLPAADEDAGVAMWFDYGS